MARSGPRFLAAADENFNNDLLRALLRRLPMLDIVRAQDTAMAGADDLALLAWTAREGRILRTHDVQTVPRFAYDRVRASQAMPGVVEVAYSAALGEALDDLLLMLAATRDDEWSDQVRFIPHLSPQSAQADFVAEPSAGTSVQRPCEPSGQTPKLTSPPGERHFTVQTLDTPIPCRAPPPLRRNRPTPARSSPRCAGGRTSSTVRGACRWASRD